MPQPTAVSTANAAPTAKPVARTPRRAAPPTPRPARINSASSGAAILSRAPIRRRSALQELGANEPDPERNEEARQRTILDPARQRRERFLALGRERAVNPPCLAAHGLRRTVLHVLHERSDVLLQGADVLDDGVEIVTLGAAATIAHDCSFRFPDAMIAFRATAAEAAGGAATS